MRGGGGKVGEKRGRKGESAGEGNGEKVQREKGR